MVSSSRQQDGLLLAGRQTQLQQSLARLRECSEALDRAAEILVETLQAEGRVLVAGNGGSAAEAEHLSAELVGRFLQERLPYAAIPLVASSSILTAIGNDYGFDEVFARQVAAYGQRGDVLVAFSTSGSSPNVIRAADEALGRGMRVIGITGEGPNSLADRSTIAVHAPARETPTIQELHLVMVHVLAEMVECRLSERLTVAEVTS
jgi:phosphoheptose isomerase